MAEIIVDIQLAETYSIGLHTPQDSNIRVDRFQKNSDSLYRFYSAILKHYRMNFQDFTAAVDWYKEHPSDMDSMMKISIDVLDQEKTKLGVSSGTQPIQVDTNYIQPPNLKGTKAGAELFNSKLKIPVLKRVPPEENKKNKLSEKK